PPSAPAPCEAMADSRARGGDSSSHGYLSVGRGRTRLAAAVRWRRSSPPAMDAMPSLVFFFFVQAEDGIRDRTVTGVQTCALPILNEEGKKASLSTTTNTVNSLSPPAIGTLNGDATGTAGLGALTQGIGTAAGRNTPTDESIPLRPPVTPPSPLIPPVTPPSPLLPPVTPPAHTPP